LNQYSELKLRFSGIIVIQTVYAEECARRDLGVPQSTNAGHSDTDPNATLTKLISALEQLGEKIGSDPSPNAVG
jgi:hypothetical protein